MKDIDIAKKYFELSNEWNLDWISEMFKENSTYSSQNTWIYLGRENIMKMMRNFFDSFKILNWEVKSEEEVWKWIILFDFILTWEKSSWEKIQMEWLEYVIIFEWNIQHIDVRNK